MSKKLKTHKSFTLLEIIISITIFSLVALGISLVFQRTLFVFRAATDKNQAAHQAQIAMDWLTSEIGTARGIFVAEEKKIALVNPDQQYIQYYYDTTTDPANPTLQRKECANPPYLLAENIADFKLKYYDINNQQISTGPFGEAPALKTVEINVVSQKNNQRFKLNTVARYQYDPTCRWAKVYGGTAKDSINCLQKTSDGGYILGGYTKSFSVGDSDFFVIKTDALGAVEWAKTYGGAAGGDVIYSLQQTSDGGYILGGCSYYLGAGNADFLVIKTDTDGNVGAGYPGTWAKTYGGTAGDALSSLQQTSDGGYILAGYSASFPTGDTNCLLIKTDANGNVGAGYPGTWAKTYGGSAEDALYALQKTKDGGYILGGYTMSFGVEDRDFLVIKVDASGDNVQWAKTYGGSDKETLYALQQTSDGGYILGGETYSLAGNGGDVFIIKLDKLGNSQWMKTYGDGGPRPDYLHALQQTSDGGYALGVESISTYGVGNFDFLLIKTNDLGDAQWAKIYGGTNMELLYSLQQTNDGGYILGGETFSFAVGENDFFLMKIGSLGELGSCCSRIIVKDISLTPGNPNPTVQDPSLSPVDVISSLTVKEYPDTSALPNFTLQVREYDGISPDDFTPSTSYICPSP